MKPSPTAHTQNTAMKTIQPLRRKTTRILAGSIAALLAIHAAAPALRAAPVTWDTAPGTVGAGDSVITGGPGTWAPANASNGNWTVNGGVNNIAWSNAGNHTAVFGGASGTVTLASGATVGGLTFNDNGGYVITGSTITLGTASIITANVNAQIDSMLNTATFGLTFAGDGDMTVNGMITGSGGLTKSGAGTLTLLSATSNYTGKTSILSGTLNLNANSGVGPGITPAGVPGQLGAATGANATIDMYNGTTLFTGTTENPRVDQTTNRTINLAGTGAGTVSLMVNDNDTAFTFGAVTATGAGAKTLAITMGSEGNGDREILNFNGNISDGPGGSPLSLQITFNSDEKANAAHLKVDTTFTGNITLVRGTTVVPSIGLLSIGGTIELPFSGGFVSTPGSSGGRLGNGNYAGSISLDTVTYLYYNNSSNQTLAGVISGNGGLFKDGTGILTLSAANTFRDDTKVIAGVLVLSNNLALQNSALDTSGTGAVTLSVTTPTIGGLKGSTNLTSVITTGYGSMTSLKLNPGTGVTDVYSGAIADNGGSNLSVTKIGLGVQNLDGTQSYNALAVNDGTLNVNGTLGTGTAAVTVADTAGGAPTTLRFGTVSQTLGSLSIGAGATVVLTSGAASASFGGDSGGEALGFGTAASTFGSGTAVVPEPGTVGLLLVGALGLLNRRRKQS